MAITALGQNQVFVRLKRGESPRTLRWLITYLVRNLPREISVLIPCSAHNPKGGSMALNPPRDMVFYRS
jgi:hypothetical protein